MRDVPSVRRRHRVRTVLMQHDCMANGIRFHLSRVCAYDPRKDWQRLYV